MIISQIIRDKSFWIKDSLTGSRIRNHYDSIKFRIENPERPHTIKEQARDLKNLLVHAANTTTFYKPFINSGLKDFPVIDKNIIRDKFSSFLSNKYKKKELITIITSGSTGTPFKLYWDKNKKNRNYADTLYFSELAGYKLGNRLLYLKIWVKERMKTNLLYWLQNTIPVDVIKLNGDQISKLIQKMEKDNSTFSLLGYSSALEEICKYLDKSNIEKVNAKVSSIISISEALNDYTRTSLEKYFDTTAHARYSNLENGILAQVVPNSSMKLLVNTASYFIELMDMEKDEPVKPGNPGRIVVTDLFNYAMPMIRYDTGDVGVISQDHFVRGNIYFDKIEGRKLDLLFDTSGNLVSSYIVYKNMWQYTEILQYQLIQEDQKRYTFKISIPGKFEKEEKLKNELKEYLGSAAEIRIEYVDEIPLLSSGKRKKIVNNYRKF